jgi:hypothetical protein
MQDRHRSDLPSEMGQVLPLDLLGVSTCWALSLFPHEHTHKRDLALRIARTKGVRHYTENRAN